MTDHSRRHVVPPRRFRSLCLVVALVVPAVDAGPAHASVTDFPTLETVAAELLPGVADGSAEYITDPLSVWLPRFTQADLREGQCVEKDEYAGSVERVRYGDSNAFVDSYPLEYVDFTFGSAARARRTLARVRRGLRECGGVTRLYEDGFVRTRIRRFDVRSLVASLPRNAIGYDLRSSARNETFVVARRGAVVQMTVVANYIGTAAAVRGLAARASTYIVR